MGRLQISRGLAQKELNDIRELEDFCTQHKPLSMKLNWEMLEKRSAGETNDFLYYESGQLIGFLGLYAIDPSLGEIEVTGMVHPDYRRKGVFTELFQTARGECDTRGIARMLLITERSSEGGVGFVKKVGSQYEHSEYRMKFEEGHPPDFPEKGIIIRKAVPRDLQNLSQLDAVCFGASETETQAGLLSDMYDSTYVAELHGEFIGKIGVLLQGEDGYIFGLGVKPELRGRGYGREILSRALRKFLSESVKTVFLEVAVENERALQLYKSCGFKVVTVYDYYEILL